MNDYCMFETRKEAKPYSVLHFLDPPEPCPGSTCSVVDNPWRCDCALHWLRSWIDEEGQRLLSSAERRLVCTEPPRLSRLSLVEVPLNSLVCIPPLVQLEPRRLAVHLGESLRVSCHASGYPRPQVGHSYRDTPPYRKV